MTAGRGGLNGIVPAHGEVPGGLEEPSPRTAPANQHPTRVGSPRRPTGTTRLATIGVATCVTRLRQAPPVGGGPQAVWPRRTEDFEPNELAVAGVARYRLRPVASGATPDPCLVLSEIH